ncbi:serine hydrolase [Aquisalimonas lutea]|uniref:serine hydrolase domain-containing protein n=1 Tax=Aquisalimonas lutea TaxID=1327750 RepID=UPI0025B4CD23|nr:serine hydrolase [Aquisalimonas lutea]MDN3517036.1 serine hydrolase [Aquisalimonas lutea]
MDTTRRRWQCSLALAFIVDPGVTALFTHPQPMVVPVSARARRAPGIRWLAFTVCLLIATQVSGANAALPGRVVADVRDRVAALERFHSLLVVHHGEPVIEHVVRGPGLDTPVNIKSLSKTVLATLVGIAIDRGVIRGAGQPVTELLGPRVPADAPAGLDAVTVGHLLSMQAGLERVSGAGYGAWVSSDNWVEYALSRPMVGEPGGRMRYSTGNTHVLSAALVEQTGRSTLALARDWLGEPLQITIPDWQRDPQGIHFGGNNMRLSPRALARFGEMIRQGGRYRGTRVVSEAWIRASWQPRGRSRFNNDQYGYGWFITDLSGHAAYYGWGFGGQMLYVVPERALTVVMTSDPTPPSSGTAYLRRLEDVVDGLLPHLASPQAARGD